MQLVTINFYIFIFYISPMYSMTFFRCMLFWNVVKFNSVIACASLLIHVTYGDKVHVFLALSSPDLCTNSLWEPLIRKEEAMNLDLIGLAQERGVHEKFKQEVMSSLQRSREDNSKNTQTQAPKLAVYKRCTCTCRRRFNNILEKTDT